MVKTERFGLLLTMDEKLLISQLAELEGGLSQAAFIRRLIHQAAQQHGLLEPNQKIHVQIKNTVPVNLGGETGHAVETASSL
jgi:hypothetical protein